MMPGHGIGPEISNAVKEVFDAAQVIYNLIALTIL